jgi:hypothetical protein
VCTASFLDPTSDRPDACPAPDFEGTRVTPGITDAIDVAVADSHACVLRADGTVWCWGCMPLRDLSGRTRTPGPQPMRIR